MIAITTTAVKMVAKDMFVLGADVGAGVAVGIFHVGAGVVVELGFDDTVMVSTLDDIPLTFTPKTIEVSLGIQLFCDA